MPPSTGGAVFILGVELSLRWKINVLTLDGHRLVYHVSDYSIVEGDFIEFTDEKTNEVKKFHASRCEIEEDSG